jgi:hypothetical protein
VGMRHVNFDLALDFDSARAEDASERFLLRAMTELAAHNLEYLRAHPDTPKLYDSGVVYLLPEQMGHNYSESEIADLRRFLSDRMRMTRAEIQHHLDLARGVEIFRDIPRIIENGGGDCDNLAAWCAAERVLAGLDVRPRMTKRVQGGRTIYHALDYWNDDGSTEDPSLILGMGGIAKAPERREECRKNVERYDNFWQDAKNEIALLPPAEREGKAVEYKALIDGIGLLPKDGIFRVGKAPVAKQVAGSWWGRRAA